MNNLQVSLSYQGNAYQFQLVRGEVSKNSVKINGVNYAVIVEKGQAEHIKEILDNISLKPINSEKQLEKRLKKLAELKDVSVSPINKVGIDTLGTRQNLHVWKEEEETNLPKMIQYVAKDLWDYQVNKKDLSGLREFLGPKEFDHAIQTKNFEEFLSLFKDLTVDQLWNIRNNENCQPKGFVKIKPYEITEEDRINLKQYLDDIGFSGSVTISDAKGTYCICPTNRESLENASFSINSISKVLTGVLALMTMEPDDFEKKLDLAPSILSFLEKRKESVYKHLEKPNLLQTMNHDGGFGDFLGNYEKVFADGLKEGTPPIINKPEDFLEYAETSLYPLNSGHYSNLGILLVALAVQHKCKDKPFDDILQELILTPAKVNIQKSKPDDGVFNPKDPCQGMLMGGPSGGYWATSNELLKFGTWLQQKCNEDPEFLSKMEKFGTEFYVREDEEIHHNGDSSVGSSFLSSFLKSGVTISVLSDQSNYMANRIYYTIRERMIEEND